MQAAGEGFFGGFIGLLFWILLLILILHPQWQYKSLKASRMRLIREIEDKYGWRVITLIHRQEKVGFLGIPIYRFIDIEDSEAVVRAIRSTPPDKPIALIIHTPGGLVLAAAQIALALKRHPAKKIVIIPHYAMSGGTLIALAADEILMDPDAVLGPLDPQISAGQHAYPAPSLVKVAREKGSEASDETLVLADIAEKSIAEIKSIVVRLLEDKMGRERALNIASKLTEGSWTHDYPLTFEEVKELGLPIRCEVPREVYELMSLYPQAIQQRPGIEYLPHPIIPARPPSRRGEG